VRLRRLFWIGAAGLLGLAALISIVALIRGEFTETDAKILGTLAVMLFAGSAALAGLALVDRGDLVPLGWLAIALGIGGGALFCWQLWAGFDHEELATDGLIAVAAALLLATARLLHRRLEWLFWASAALTTLSAVAVASAVHQEPEGDNWPRVIGTLLILTGLAWFLVPVLGRASTRGPERVVGQGPGTFEVELAEGETLVVRR
jgi:hypothetical protein